VASPRPLVLVGPTHPYTGGISQHTTRLALELEKAGVPVTVESWKAQYPRFLYPGTSTVPDGEPEVGIPSEVTTALAWYSPVSWWQAGRRHRGHRVIVSIPTAFHAVPYTVLSWGLGRNRDLWGIVHNVIPHDSGKKSSALMGRLLRRLDRIVVHSESARSDAVSLGVSPGSITVLSLPSPWPEHTDTAGEEKTVGPLKVLFFGTIRPYKGLDLALAALQECDGVELTIAGEFWEEQSRYEELIDSLGLTDRVTIIPGYLPSQRFAEVFSAHDVLLLPYRQGTGSIVREVGFRFGLPVIATSVGSIGEGVDHDQTGLLIEPNSVPAIRDALAQASNHETRKRWAKAVASRAEKNLSAWSSYVEGVTKP
jgi:glycosyltransferase involved in cell wall biosynthesis